MNAYDPAAWLEAKETIARLIHEELLQKPKKTRAKVARIKNGKNSDAPRAKSTTPNMDDEVEGDVNRPSVPPQNSGSKQGDALPVMPTSAKKQFKPIYRERTPVQIQHDQFGRE